MGQAFRRASGRIRAPAPPSSPSQLNKPLDRTQPAASVDNKVPVGGNVDPSSDGQPRNTLDDVPEERDSEYDAMLSKMVGRIQTKPGGKLEMGEAFVVDKYKRPMPKLRNTTAETGRYEQRPAPPGTLNVAQLRHIILLYQGKADDHNGPMDVNQIAEKFKVDVAQVQRAVQFLSMPPEYFNKQKKDPR
ncbi:hypothetical protein HanRHA438_Chr03g0134041 [Helianthus annuus]|uniref:Uncharacterized protein n=1 Tax=Helianthus annuus TaxID=4232 RepID=A0A251V8D0_HELAN|nr:uncharacterized protein LOC110929948 [Helianthus annuus]KAF5815347.1 hypothetical protein HanXRQr2_Chr03g0122081 [Helianthus annuus]KAJ0593837.1 hypothetical protein HanHA300_Chr03g0101961 [Helianthus annuus]KAJ0608860.1 hypothetical protein HanHA89_Chr03g0113641 [Helianthus annuus]KAJ0768901.1 hypothetical protein HanLR1_Chr03g0106951 [Helianthus annuus]KAJ0936697.1 hypothetical protein HanRHA438_Chr03g0134041 [Helianthus annuus]